MYEGRVADTATFVDNSEVGSRRVADSSVVSFTTRR